MQRVDRINLKIGVLIPERFEISSMVQQRIQEISSWLKHGDYDLARRRLLDLVYDTDQKEWLMETILWSKEFQEAKNLDNWLQHAKEILERCNGFQQHDNTKKSDVFLIQSEGISKTYFNGFFSLKPIAVHLQPGEIIGVVGENGNGKTTLLRSIAGQLESGIKPSNFSYLKGDEFFFYDLKYSTGFIPQRIPRWYGKLRDNLHFTAATHGLKGAQNDLMVDFVLERFGLSKFANLKWTQISSGYRTRFEIARLILQRPPVLILDEPLANLDIIAQQTLLQDLRFIARSTRHPMGVLLTSQQLFEVEKVADRVLFIQKGIGKYNDTSVTEGFHVFEIETTASREQLESALGENATRIRYNGGIFEIEAAGDEQKCLELLVNQKLPVHYFRNITHSAKRYF
ncbi:MAG: ABC transporter ATP-binding protein [Bacteroidetes bacterium]|nr:ABC transporter ATP-binding protein [Bacteroidota bacterium]